jgi:hypothetical protein
MRFMTTVRRIAAASLIGAALLLAGSHAARAQDADTAEVQRYVLTDAGLAKYSQATKKLASLPRDPAACSDEGDGSGSQSIDQMAAKLGAVPGAKAAVQAAGMSLREYVVFSMSLLQNGLAAWALDQPGGKLPQGVSKANVDFVRKHDAQLKQLHGLSPHGCDDDAAEDEATE